ncbi:MAG: hypothetical protein HYS23_03670 [Geobacter sp.]|nr:hypothetical protein [Geobacter sp.]
MPAGRPAFDATQTPLVPVFLYKPPLAVPAYQVVAVVGSSTRESTSCPDIPAGTHAACAGASQEKNKNSMMPSNDQ